VTEAQPHDRISVVWSPQARNELRAIDRETALQILHCLDRYLANRSGDVKRLKPPLDGYRLRCADYRLFFDFRDPNTIEILTVQHRKQAYR